MAACACADDEDDNNDALNQSLAVDDFDSVAGAKRRSPGTASGGGGSDDNADAGPKYYDPNIEMMKSGDWGANIKGEDEYHPAILPERPGAHGYMQRVELTLGRTTNKPRDRPHTKMAVEPDPTNIKLPPIKQVPEHMRSPKFMKRREDKAFGRTTNRLKVTNRKAIEQLSQGAARQ